jgi:hypothetical protein
MLTDVKANNMRVALQQIYVNLYVEYGMEWNDRAIVKDHPLWKTAISTNRFMFLNHSRKKPAFSC